MWAQPGASRRFLPIVTSAVCLLMAGTADDAGAQPRPSVNATTARSLAKVCGRTSPSTACEEAVKGQGLKGAAKAQYAKVLDAFYKELKTAPPPKPSGQSAPPAPPTSRSMQWGMLSTTASPDSQVIWDGTFAHPDAPGFYILRGSVSPDVLNPEAACAQLPDPLRTDKDLLVKLVCRAERELLAAGPDKWPDESREFETLRQRLAACLPPPTANPCSVP